MKKRIYLFKKATYVLAAMLVLIGCQNFDNPPLGEFPGDAPLVAVLTPLNGSVINSSDEFSSIIIEYAVTDDVEIISVKISLDGQELISLSDFPDPKNVSGEFEYDSVITGDHVLTIEAEDNRGLITTSNVEFSKVDLPEYATLFGEKFYIPFEDNFTDLVSNQEATQVGTPGFGSGLSGKAYQGAADSYLTFPGAGLLTPEFSATMWINLNSSPDRAGILAISPPDTSNPDNPNNRSSGFRLFRENNGGNQILKLNIGTGGDNWFDGGAAAALPEGDWAHVAISISATHATVYINGVIVSEGDFSGLDWTDCDLISIASGHPRFVEWGHASEESPIDELRFFDRAITQTEVQTMMDTPISTFRMAFDGDNFTDLVSGAAATAVGTPSASAVGYNSPNAYQGAADSYLTFPSDGLITPEFSATMWYKLSATPDRGGILVIGPEDTGNASYPDIQNKRTNGFRFFREGGATNQTFKLNVGNGGGDNWFDGGATATIDPTTTTDWVHLAFTISGSECVVYINGEVVSQGGFSGVDWTGCDMISIMSGGPRFSEWGHASDLSALDDLNLFNKALTHTEIQTIMSN